MVAVKKIKKGDLVKLISGAKKGTTGKVIAVLSNKESLLIEGIGNIHRNVKASAQNPRGGHKDIHVPTPISKVALVIDEKTSKTSRVGMLKNNDGNKVRVARQNNNKEVK